MSLPEKLVALRKQAGLTQLELAEKLEVSRQAISKWELGTAVPGTDNLKMLSKLYGVSIDALLGGEEDVSVPQESPEQQEPPKEDAKPERRNDRGGYIYAAVVTTLILLLVAALTWSGRRHTTMALIGDIESTGEDGYSTQAFSLNTEIFSQNTEAASQSASAETGATYTVQTPDTRTTGGYSIELGAKTKALADVGFLLAAQDDVTIKACYAPLSASVDFGLVAPDGTFYYVGNTSGSMDKTIVMEQSGKYTLQIRNNSDTPVQIVGFVWY